MVVYELSIRNSQFSLLFHYHTVSPLECHQHASFSQGVQASKGGVTFQFVERHLHEQLRDAFISKRVGHHIHAREVKDDLLAPADEFHQLLAQLLSHVARTEVGAVFYELKLYHNVSSSFVSTNVSLYSSAASVRCSTIWFGSISSLVPMTI